jgi:hypothetical protein
VRRNPSFTAFPQTPALPGFGVLGPGESQDLSRCRFAVTSVGLRYGAANDSAYLKAWPSREMHLSRRWKLSFERVQMGGAAPPNQELRTSFSSHLNAFKWTRRIDIANRQAPGKACLAHHIPKDRTQGVAMKPA